MISGGTATEANLKMEAVVAQFFLWCEINKLVVNYAKTKFVEFTERYKSLMGGDLSIRNANTQWMNTWINQVDCICGKLNKAYYGVYSLKRYLNHDVHY